MVRKDLVPFTEDQGPLDGVFELADVAGPVVCGQGPKRLGVETDRAALFLLGGEFLDEMSRQDRDIFGTLAQRRDEDREDRQAEEEILAEGAGDDLGLQVFVAGGDQAEVDPPWLVAPAPPELLLIHHPP